jgi:hypothetical protein
MELSKFVDCCKQKTEKFISENVTCSLAGFNFLKPVNSSLPECQDKEKAEIILDQLTGGAMTSAQTNTSLLIMTFALTKVSLEFTTTEGQ